MKLLGVSPGSLEESSVAGMRPEFPETLGRLREDRGRSEVAPRLAIESAATGNTSAFVK